MNPQLALTALALTASSLASATETRVSYSAAAFALDGGQLLYVEKHVETLKEGRLAEREVRYEDPAGQLIAEKLVRYDESPVAPSFEMTDFRIGLREAAEVGSDRVSLFSGATDARDQAKSVALPDGAVIDAGFDAFMRENFSEILAGGRLEFDFAVPAVRRFFKFQLLPQGKLNYKGEEGILVRMKPASRLLRLVLDPIDLVYSRGGRLLEFRGLSNVCDEQGDRYKVRIVFDYEAKPAAVKVAGLAPTVTR